MTLLAQTIWLNETVLSWTLFNVTVAGLLLLDLFVFNRKAHVIHFKEAILWSVFWVALALAFCVGVYFWKGRELAVETLTGYIVELSMSVDNLFVFLVLFSYFRVPPHYQHRLLFWGIVGAVVMRALFILAGVALFKQVHWVIYIFGAFLVYTGFKMAFQGDTEVHPEKNPVLRLARKFLRVTPDYVQGRFFTRANNLLHATPLFIVLLVVESTDVIFAVDSVPAVIGVMEQSARTNMFLVYASNILAVLGLRAMYFALAGLIEKFHLLHYGLAAVLIFVGVRMCLPETYDIPINFALTVILAVLVLSIIASLFIVKKPKN